MSETSATIHRGVRLLIDDLNPESYAISSVRLARIVQSNVQGLSQRLILPMVAPETVNLVAGTYDYALTLATSSIRQCLLESDGSTLTRMSLEKMNAYYKQDSASPAGRSTPLYYAIREENTQSVVMRVAPTPAANDTLNIYRDNRPASTAGDTTDVPFSTEMCRALEKSCAIECMLSMSVDERQRRMVSPEIVGRWQEDIDRAVRGENARQRFLGRSQSNVGVRDIGWPLFR